MPGNRVMAGLLPALLAALSLAGCTSSASTHGSGDSAIQATGADPLQAMVRSAIDRFNAGAGGPVADQQTTLSQLIDPGQRDVQQRCPTPTHTLSLDPVYAELAPAPGWHPPSGSLSGSVYSLPTVIRVYSGNRIIGTDLTDLRVAVKAGQVTLASLCIS